MGTNFRQYDSFRQYSFYISCLHFVLSRCFIFFSIRNGIKIVMASKYNTIFHKKCIVFIFQMVFFEISIQTFEKLNMIILIVNCHHYDWVSLRWTSNINTANFCITNICVNLCAFFFLPICIILIQTKSPNMMGKSFSLLIVFNNFFFFQEKIDYFRLSSGIFQQQWK